MDPVARVQQLGDGDQATGAAPYSRAVPERQPVNVTDYERLAAERLEPGVHGYFAGGAGDERTLRENVAAFERRRLRPRVLVDVSGVSTATTVLGAEISMPLLVAPVAFQRLVDPDGEVAMARAAAAAGTVMTLSTAATSHPSEIAAEAPPAPRWFQLYCFSDRGVTEALIDEAVDSGFEAIVLTADAPRAGRRERDLRTGFAVPRGGHRAGGRRGDRRRTGRSLPRGCSSSSTRASTGTTSPPSSPTARSRCCSRGCRRPRTRRLAVERGAAGVIVSNHGGRQLDGVARLA